MNAEEHALAAFLERHPEYAATQPLDALRREEFSRLDRGGHAYLDYTGSGLYADVQIRRYDEWLRRNVFGNPHSINPTSSASTEAVERCRRHVLAFFSADPAEYAVVFTANASHALKLVGEAYPFHRGDEFLLTFDNHNSVNGIREFARAHGAEIRYIPLRPSDMRIADEVVDAFLASGHSDRHRLFAFPAQSNFSGVQHPLAWIEQAHRYGCDVLLDAAAFVPTNRLDLSQIKPDFVTLSFYKMFGFPTGIGALVARHDALARLHRPWFAGGTIDVVSVQADQFRLTHGSAAFEDGTPNFLAASGVEFGLELLESADLSAIHARVRALTAWLVERCQELTHANGRPLLRLYGPVGAERRGGTVAFNVADADGAIVDHAIVDERAAARGVSLRTGCFCNPGAGELALGLTRSEIATCLADVPGGMTYEDFRRCIDPKAAGAVRASLGIVSNFTDVWRLEHVLGEFRSA